MENWTDLEDEDTSPEEMKAFEEKVHYIFEATKAFLDKETEPKEGLLQYVQNYFKTEKSELSGMLYATVRKSVEVHKQQKLSSLDHHRATLFHAGLNIEKVICHKTAPEEITKNISTLNSGAYILSIPVYLLGYRVGRHALSLIVDESKNYYFLDPNYGIGSARQKQSSAVFNRIYQNYGNYSESLFTLYQVDTITDRSKPGSNNPLSLLNTSTNALQLLP